MSSPARTLDVPAVFGLGPPVGEEVGATVEVATAVHVAAGLLGLGKAGPDATDFLKRRFGEGEIDCG